MNKRLAIFSETEFYTRDRRRDPDVFRKKPREKTLEELEKESEDQLLSQIYCMKNLYNQVESSTKNEAQTTDFIIELLKESILSDRQDISLFSGIKRQKRRNSFNLTQEISVNQYIDNLNLSIQKNNNNKTTLTIVFKSNSAQTTNDDEDGLSGMIESNFTKHSTNNNNLARNNYFSCPNVNLSLAQNIIPEEKIRLMFVSNRNDVITRLMILYFIHDTDCYSHDSWDFNIKKKVYQLNHKKSIILALYDTKMPFHNSPASQSYYLFIDICIYFINNNQHIEETLNEVKEIYTRISNTNQATQMIIISNIETPIELKDNIQLMSQSIFQYGVESSDEFNRIVLHKLITNFLLKKAPIKKHSSEDDDDFLYAISDDLNCRSAYSMEDKDYDDDDDGQPDSKSKFGRCKSIR